jgi:hypothetical protein
MNPQYSVLSINPQYSVLSINPRQRKKRPLPCVLSRKNTTERLIHPVYREFQHSADGFPSQDFKTVVNAVDERVRGFRLMVKEHEGSFSWSRTMRVWSSLFQREGFGLLSLGDEGFVSSSLNTRVLSHGL